MTSSKNSGVWLVYLDMMFLREFRKEDFQFLRFQIPLGDRVIVEVVYDEDGRYKPFQFIQEKAEPPSGTFSIRLTAADLAILQNFLPNVETGYARWPPGKKRDSVKIRIKNADRKDLHTFLNCYVVPDTLANLPEPDPDDPYQKFTIGINYIGYRGVLLDGKEKWKTTNKE